MRSVATITAAACSMFVVHTRCCMVYVSTNPSVVIQKVSVIRFYRAMLCIRGTSHGPVSLSVSVCHKSENF